jgi:hypothetical protein
VNYAYFIGKLIGETKNKVLCLGSASNIRPRVSQEPRINPRPEEAASVAQKR